MKTPTAVHRRTPNNLHALLLILRNCYVLLFLAAAKGISPQEQMSQHSEKHVDSTPAAPLQTPCRLPAVPRSPPLIVIHFVFFYVTVPGSSESSLTVGTDFPAQ